MIKYYYINKEISMATGEVIVRLVSMVALTSDQVIAELGDDNWFEYQTDSNDLPYYMQYTENNGVVSINTNPPAGAKIKHMYAGLDMYNHVYHQGNLDISQFKQQNDEGNYQTQRIFVESGKPSIVIPNNTYISSETVDGKEAPLIYMNKDNRVFISSNGIPTQIADDLYVNKNIYAGENVTALNDVFVKRTNSDGSTKIVSLYNLSLELDKLKKKIEQLEQMDGTPIGTIMAFPNIESIPLDYIICDGRTFDVNIYKELHALLKSNKVPDLRSAFMRGVDMGKGVDPGRMPMTWQKGDTGAAPHRHITGIWIEPNYDSIQDDIVFYQDYSLNIGDVNLYNWVGRYHSGNDQGKDYGTSYNTRLISNRNIRSFTLTHDKVFVDTVYANQSIKPDNVSVIFAMKAINLNGKATGQTDNGNIGSGTGTQPGQGDSGLTPAQNLQLTLLIKSLTGKYNKTGGTVTGSVQAQSNFTCNKEINPARGAYFQDFNDLSEFFQTIKKFESGWVLSLINDDTYDIRTANESVYVAGVSISKDETAMLIGAETETNTPIALKGRVYVYADSDIPAGTHVYLSESEAGKIGTIPNKHYIGLTVTNTINGMNRVLVRT